MRIVCNSTILIALPRIGHLWILEKLFASLTIPTAVYNDVVVKGSGKPGARDVAEARWIHVQEVSDIEALDELASVLHQGEAEAIALAQEMAADLIILDDKLARKTAMAVGLNVAGTLAILHLAKERNLIPELKSLLDALKSTGFHIGEEYDEILRNAGEV